MVLKFFNEQYTGKTERDIDEPYNYYGSGSTGNIIDLKNSNDICDYKVGFKYKYNPTMIPGDLQTIYSDCEKNVKFILTEDKQYFSSVDGPLYTYTLKSLGFKKLFNHYFDYLLISDSFDESGQIVEKLNSLDEFFIAKKTNKERDEITVKTKEQFIREQKIFEKFVNSIVAYNPIIKQPKEFKEIKGEDLNITSIRKYYWLIETGNLKDAYVMRADNLFSNLDDFEKSYRNTYSTEVSDFEKNSDNQYDFKVKYQDHNSDEQFFHIIMEVKDDKLKTIFVEEYLTDKAEFNNMTAFATKRDDKNYLILQKNGKEIIVDEGAATLEGTYEYTVKLKFFDNIKFSPKGNYLTYDVSGYEYYSGKIYDIDKDSDITKSGENINLSGADFNFTDDEKYFYFCSNVGMASGRVGNVYSIPDFKLKFDILKDERSKKFMSVGCEYRKSDNSIVFKSFDYNDKDLEIKYNLSTGKVE